MLSPDRLFLPDRSFSKKKPNIGTTEDLAVKLKHGTSEMLVLWPFIAG
jgi:hypothetical protein